MLCNSTHIRKSLIRLKPVYNEYFVFYINMVWNIGKLQIDVFVSVLAVVLKYHYFLDIIY